MPPSTATGRHGKVGSAPAGCQGRGDRGGLMTELGSVPGRPATTARAGTARRPPAPPPRPALASDLAPPLRAKRPVDGPAAALAATLPWFAGLVAALIGVVATAADGEALRARLTAGPVAHDPTLS